MVIQSGGEWEDRWETILCGCGSKELAETVKAKVEDFLPKIKIDELQEAMDEYFSENPDDEDINYTKLAELHPEHTAKEWEEADTFYISEGPSVTYIKEIPTFTSYNDIDIRTIIGRKADKD